MTSLAGGFADPPRDAAHAFRAVMTAMARPGRIQRLTGALPPAPLSVAAGTLILTLCDTDTPLYLAGRHDSPDLRAWITFHTGAPVGRPDDCDFAVGDWDALLPLSAYRVGTPEYPDRAATLVVQMPRIVATGARLTGPGIEGSALLSLPDGPMLAAGAAMFPLGLDLFLTSGEQVAALPRSTRIEPETLGMR